MTCFKPTNNLGSMSLFNSSSQLSRLWLDGIELGFFLVAGTELCFGFSIGIMMITHWCVGCCWVVITIYQGLFSNLPVREGTGSWEGAWEGQLTQKGQIHIAHYRMSCSPYKLGTVGQKALITAGHDGASVDRWWTVLCIIQSSCPLLSSLSLYFSLQILLVVVLALY